MQTISVELAKKLKEMELIRPAFFSWVHNYFPGSKIYGQFVLTYLADPAHTATYPAYSLDEILEYLPKCIPIKHKVDCFFRLHLLEEWGVRKEYYIEYYQPSYEGDVVMITRRNKNAAEAAGELLLWCIENGYIKTEKEEKVICKQIEKS